MTTPKPIESKWLKPQDIVKQKLITNTKGKADYGYILRLIKNGRLKAKNKGFGKTPYFVVHEDEIARYRKERQIEQNSLAWVEMLDEMEAYITERERLARVEERKDAQGFLHGLTITPESRHLFEVLSRNNHDRLTQLQSKEEVE